MFAPYAYERERTHIANVRGRPMRPSGLDTQ